MMDEPGLDAQAKTLAEDAISARITEKEALNGLASCIEQSKMPEKVVRGKLHQVSEQVIEDAVRRLKDKLVERCLRGTLFDFVALTSGGSFQRFIGWICKNSPNLIYPSYSTYPVGLDFSTGTGVGPDFRNDPKANDLSFDIDQQPSPRLSDFTFDIDHRMDQALRLDVAARTFAVYLGVKRLFTPVGDANRMAASQQINENPACLVEMVRKQRAGHPDARLGPLAETLRYHSIEDAEMLVDLEPVELRALAAPLGQPQPKITKAAITETIRGFSWEKKQSSKTAELWCVSQSHVFLNDGLSNRKPDDQIAAELAAFEDAASTLCEMSWYRSIAEIDKAINASYLEAVSKIQAERHDRRILGPMPAP